MKITLIGPVFPYRGGIAHFTTLLVVALKKQGHHVSTISYKKQFPAWLYPGKSDQDHGPGRIQVDAKYLFSPFNPADWMAARRQIMKEKPDLVILEWWVTFWAPAMGLLARWLNKNRIPFLYIIHNAYPHEPRFFDPALAKYALSPATRFIVMNQREKERIAELCKPGSEITQCPLPVFSAFPKSKLTQKEARQKLGLPAGRLILFFGIIRPYKGLRVLLKAVSLVKARGYEDIGLVVAGEFWEAQQSYLDQIRELGIKERVWIFDHFISDLDTSLLFKAANLFVGPYLDGTQSASVKAALNFGIPMVVTSIVSDEIMEKIPQTCRVVPPGDPGQLADGIIAMIDRPFLSSSEINSINARSWEKIINAISGK